MLVKDFAEKLKEKAEAEAKLKELQNGAINEK